MRTYVGARREYARSLKEVEQIFDGLDQEEQLVEAVKRLRLAELFAALPLRSAVMIVPNGYRVTTLAPSRFEPKIFDHHKLHEALNQAVKYLREVEEHDRCPTP
jgi:hypothetical protein